MRHSLFVLALLACHKTPSGVASSSELLPSQATEPAPPIFKARLSTTQGDLVIEVHRDWSPLGAARFYNLVKMGFFNDVAFFRVIDGFMAQFGIHGDPKVSAVWRTATIADDPPASPSNKRGYVTFAKGGPNSRTTQLFINLADNPRLDAMGFPPIGQVVEGNDVLEKIFKVGEGKPAGPGPAQGRVQMEGNAFLKQEYPQLDYIKSARID
jgi:peptidyl-prolyl cis-trans isomerase A (cyclophilin A)